LREKLKDIICEYTFIERNELESIDGDDLLTQIGLDSINIVYIIGEIESEFGFSFQDEELVLDNFETFNKIIDLISKYTE
jgi:Acyl carrier protein